MRWGNFKAVFSEQRAQGNALIWANPFTPLRLPKLYNLRMDPYERADITSDQYWDWEVKNAYLVGEATMKASVFLETFVDYPPSQRPASFSVDQVRKHVDKKIDEAFAKRGLE
jgi:arylsulfatase